MIFIKLNNSELLETLCYLNTFLTISDYLSVYPDLPSSDNSIISIRSSFAFIWNVVTTIRLLVLTIKRSWWTKTISVYTMVSAAVEIQRAKNRYFFSTVRRIFVSRATYIGIALLILIKWRTVHFEFKTILNLSNRSKCAISTESHLTQIVWSNPPTATIAIEDSLRIH